MTHELTTLERAEARHVAGGRLVPNVFIRLAEFIWDSRPERGTVGYASAKIG